MPNPSGHGDTPAKMNTVDRVVSWFSPQRGLKRQAARILLRQYAAAKDTRMTGNWMPVDPPVNDLVSSSQRQVRARVRQLVRDFPFFARAVNVLTDLTVGTGIDFQARVKNPDGSYNQAVNRQIEDAWLRWMEQADISGRLHFHELTRLSDRSDIEAGESLFVMRQPRNRYIPFALQAIEPDRLAEFQAQAAGGNEIEQGIEYNPETGEAVAYHIVENGYKYNVKRIPADQVVHTFQSLRPEQIRGISPFASAVLAADDLHSFIDSTLDTAKMASRYLAMVTTPDAASFQSLRATDGDGGRKIEELENAIIEYLNPGEQVNFANHQIPNDQFDPFTKFILRMVAVATDTSFELLSGDYSGLSYSNLKAIRADLVRGIKPRFERRKLHFCNPVYRRFLEQAALSGRVTLPGYARDPYKYERCQWIWQGMESPDPLRDGKAAVNLIESNLMSPQEHAAARGRDYEEILDEIAEAKKQQDRRGITAEDVSTAMANNPASVDSDTSDRSGDMNVVPIRKRSGNPDGVVTRSMPVSPSSLNKGDRSIEVTMATETPVEVYTWEHGLVEEVLLMDGAEYADRIPLLDTHDRFSSNAVLGSVTSIRHANGEMVGKVAFSRTAEDIMTKVEEGHLTDFSVGYRPIRSVFIPEGESQVISGRSFDGPKLVTDRWKIKELSICAIGADENAKARAEAFNYKTTEDEKMDKKTREMLIARGLDPNATEEQAWAFFDELTRAEPPKPQEPKADPKPEPKVDPDQARAEAARQERERVTEIMAMGQRYEMAEDAKQAVDNGTSTDEFRKAVLDAQMKKPDDGPSFRAEVGREESEKVRAAVTDGLLIRGGVSPEKPAPGSDEFAGYALREIAREMLKRSGQQVPRNVMEMVGRSLTTSDFPLILANVANKFLFDGFESANETWREWCATGSVSDFKTHHLVRPSEMDDLDEVPESAEYKYGKRTEAEEQYKIATYGKLLSISRQALINDDLSALQDTPRAHGEAAARKIGDLPYAVLSANAAMGDGVALFHDTHANQDTHAVVAVGALNDGFTKMALQKDLQNKRRLNIRPQFYIGPVATMGTVEQFFQTNYIGGEANQPNLVNIYGGGVLKRVYEPRIDDDNAELWYLAGPRGKTITVFFLNGVQTPYLETRQGWNVDGVEYKVRIDAGAKAVDWRALYRNQNS